MYLSVRHSNTAQGIGKAHEIREEKTMKMSRVSFRKFCDKIENAATMEKMIELREELYDNFDDGKITLGNLDDLMETMNREIRNRGFNKISSAPVWMRGA